MATSDPIADMLTRIRNAHAGAPSQGGRAGVEAEDGNRAHPQGRRLHRQLQAGRGRRQEAVIRIYLKYTPGNVPVISRIERVSRPGCRVYVGSKEVPARAGRPGNQYPDHPARRDDRRTARKEDVGGEVLCQVW